MNILQGIKHKVKKYAQDMEEKYFETDYLADTSHDSKSDGSPWVRDVLRDVAAYDRLSDTPFLDRAMTIEEAQKKREAMKNDPKYNPSVNVSVTPCSKNPLHLPRLFRAMDLFRSSQDIMIHERLIDVVTQEGSLVISMDIGDDMAGAILFRPNAEDHHAEIVAFGVKYRFLGQGVGGYLIRAMENILQQNSIDVCWGAIPITVAHIFEGWGYSHDTDFVSDWMALNAEGLYRIRDFRQYEAFRVRHESFEIGVPGITMEKHLNIESAEEAERSSDGRIRTRMYEIEALAHWEDSHNMMPKDYKRYGIYKDTKHPHMPNLLQSWIRRSFVVRKQMSEYVTNFWPKQMNSGPSEVAYTRAKLQEMESNAQQRRDVLSLEFPGIDPDDVFHKEPVEELNQLEEEDLQIRRQWKEQYKIKLDSRDYKHLKDGTQWYAYRPQDDPELVLRQQRIRLKIETGEDFSPEDLAHLDSMPLTDQELIQDYYRLRAEVVNAQKEKDDRVLREAERDETVPKLWWEKLFDPEDPIQEHYKQRTAERQKLLKEKQKRDDYLDSVHDPNSPGLAHYLSQKEDLFDTVESHLRTQDSPKATPLLELRFKQLQTLFGDDLFGVVSDFDKDANLHGGLAKSERPGGVDLDNYRTQGRGTFDNPDYGASPRKFTGWMYHKIPEEAIVLGVDSSRGMFTVDPQTGEMVQTRAQLPPVGGIAGVPVGAQYSSATSTGVTGYTGGANIAGLHYPPDNKVEVPLSQALSNLRRFAPPTTTEQDQNQQARVDPFAGFTAVGLAPGQMSNNNENGINNSVHTNVDDLFGSPNQRDALDQEFQFSRKGLPTSFSSSQIARNVQQQQQQGQHQQQQGQYQQQQQQYQYQQQYSTPQAIEAPYGYHPKSGLPLPPPGSYAPGVGFNTFSPQELKGNRPGPDLSQQAPSGYNHINIETQGYHGLDPREEKAPATGFGRISRFFGEVIDLTGGKFKKDYVESYDGLHDHQFNRPPITSQDDPRYKAMTGAFEEEGGGSAQQTALERMADQARKAKLRREIHQRDATRQEFVEAAVLIPKEDHFDKLKKSRNWKLLENQTLLWTDFTPPPIPLPDGTMPHHHNHDTDSGPKESWLDDNPGVPHRYKNANMHKNHPEYGKEFFEQTQPTDYRLESFRDWKDLIENVHPDLLHQFNDKQREEFNRIKTAVEDREKLFPYLLNRGDKEKSAAHVMRLNGLRKLHHDEWKQQGAPVTDRDDPNGPFNAKLPDLSDTELERQQDERLMQWMYGTKEENRGTMPMRPIIPEELGKALFFNPTRMNRKKRYKRKDYREIQQLNEQTQFMDEVGDSAWEKKRDEDIKNRYKRIMNEHRALYQKKHLDWEQKLLTADILHANYQIQSRQEARLLTNTQLAPDHLLKRRNWEHPYLLRKKFRDNEYDIAHAKDPWFADGEFVPEAFWHPL